MKKIYLTSLSLLSLCIISVNIQAEDNKTVTVKNEYKNKVSVHLRAKYKNWSGGETKHKNGNFDLEQGQAQDWKYPYFRGRFQIAEITDATQPTKKISVNDENGLETARKKEISYIEINKNGVVYAGPNKDSINSGTARNLGSIK